MTAHIDSPSIAHEVPSFACALRPKEADLRRATQSLPGPVYLAALVWIHRALQPATYVEIGVDDGESLRAVQPETLCVGIDPAPHGRVPTSPTTRLFHMTSDAFFAAHDLSAVLGRPSFSLAFIDGLHQFEQALRDFMHLERFADRASVILVHDCLPLNRATSARVRTTEFYSGDVWKLALCLHQSRQHLRMVMVPTPPTGLCIVSGLDPTSTVLEKDYHRSVARYVDLTFDDYQSRLAQMPPYIPNTKAAITSYVAGLRGETR